jgi:hypothetical protein
MDRLYIDPSLGEQTIPIYTYIINGQNELELKTGGVTFATLTKQ